MTPKDEWIKKLAFLICHDCSRIRRIKERLNRELKDDDFDYEKDLKATQIIAEEA